MNRKALRRNPECFFYRLLAKKQEKIRLIRKKVVALQIQNKP